MNIASFYKSTASARQRFKDVLYNHFSKAMDNEVNEVTKVAEVKKDTDTEEYTKDKIVNSIIEQFISRSNVGVTKYGTTLEENNLQPLEWIEHAKQEAMDFILYLEKLKSTIQS